MAYLISSADITQSRNLSSQARPTSFLQIAWDLHLDFPVHNQNRHPSINSAASFENQSHRDCFQRAAWIATGETGMSLLPSPPPPWLQVRLSFDNLSSTAPGNNPRCIGSSSIITPLRNLYDSHYYRNIGPPIQIADCSSLASSLVGIDLPPRQDHEW